MSWALSALGGLVIGAVLFVVADWSYSASVGLAVAVTLIVGLFISVTICSGGKGTGQKATPAARKPGAGETASRSAAPSETTATPAAPQAKAAPASSASSTVKPSHALPGQAELAARKGSWKYEGDKTDAATDAQTSAPAATAAPAPSATSDTDKSTGAAGSGDGAPELLDAPRPGGKDDLKRISGVGPKLEETLNEMGIWHFDQVAAWRKEEIEWVDERLRFKGRIERDDWVSQARTLAQGGETEFSGEKNS